MKRFEAPCPSCGGTVEFKTGSSLVAVCPFCRSAVARADRKLEDLGKVAAVAQTDTALYVGQTGRFRDRPFEIVGHVQYQHPAGGIWDEYYAALAGEKWLWIAEAQGKFYVTQEKTTPADFAWPDPSALAAGERVTLGSFGEFVVDEVNQATLAAAEGEIPFSFTPGGPHRFADLSGKDQAFVTLDFSGREPKLYGGKQVSLADLGLSARETPEEKQKAVIGGTAIPCPHCGGPLELKAPELAQRMTCSFCNSILDVEQGNLRYLGPAGQLQIRPHIPLGTEGTLRGAKYTVIGFLRRTVQFDREYPWDEYLLYNPQQGFRWLVHSDCHWNFVQPASPADMPREGMFLTYQGARFRLFQSAWATVRYVAGEFYWKVAAGEMVMADDYIAPPRAITLEFVPERPPPGVPRRDMYRDQQKFVEVTASLADYLPHAELEQAFGVKDLPRGFAIAPNQPSPVTWDVYLYYPLFLAALVAIDGVLGLTLPHRVDHGMLFWAIVGLTVFPVLLMVYQWSFERRRWEDSQYNPYDPETSDGGGSGGGFFLFGGNPFVTAGSGLLSTLSSSGDDDDDH